MIGALAYDFARTGTAISAEEATLSRERLAQGGTLDALFASLQPIFEDAEIERFLARCLDAELLVGVA
jgi:hypothetical protein